MFSMQGSTAFFAKYGIIIVLVKQATRTDLCVVRCFLPDHLRRDNTRRNRNNGIPHDH
jgi:hypothetical protein